MLSDLFVSSFPCHLFQLFFFSFWRKFARLVALFLSYTPDEILTVAAFIVSVKDHWEADALCRVSHKQFLYKYQEERDCKGCQRVQLTHAPAGAKRFFSE